MFVTHCCLAAVLVLGLVMDQGSGDDSFINLLIQEIMAKQLYIEERVRSQGQSGLKQDSHKFENKDLANNKNRVGMAQVEAVLNGVEFRTKKNDYR